MGEKMATKSDTAGVAAVPEVRVGFEPEPIRPELYCWPPDIDGSTPAELMAALHLLERKFFIPALRKILREMTRRIEKLEGGR